MGLVSTSEKISVKGRSGKAESYRIPFILVTALFFLWGLANSLNGILVHHFQTALDLTRTQVSFIDSAFYIGYFVMALPAGYLLKRFGYKKGIIAGLLIYAAGAFLFFPASNMRIYGFFLFALFVIACGVAILETAANPYITVLGPPETSVNRLNFSQSFNGMSLVLGPLIGSMFIFSSVENTQSSLAHMPHAQAEVIRIAEAHSVQMPYVTIGIIVLLFAVLFMVTRMPEIESNEADPMHLEKGSVWSLFRHRHLSLGMLAQFLDVGAQASIWSYFTDIKLKFAPHADWSIIRSLYHISSDASPSQVAAAHFSFAFVLFMLGRFVGTYLMTKIKPHLVLAFYAFSAVVLVAYGMTGNGIGAVIAIMFVFFFHSIMFPTIFALATKSLGSQVKMGSSLVIMSIVGGAICPILTGFISQHYGLNMGLIVPLVCFVYIMYYALSGYRVTGSSLENNDAGIPA